jgi:hypothetical protein
MSVYYVRSTTGSDSNNGSTWALAKQTITGALNISSPGDIIYVSQAHNYYFNGAITYPAKGTANAPVLVICVSDAQQPPTQLATTAIENNLSASADVSHAGGSYIYWYGINLKSQRSIYFPAASTQTFESCSFQLLNATTGYWAFDAGSNSTFLNLQFINSNFQTAWSGTSLYFTSSHQYYAASTSYVILLRGCTFSGTAITNIITWNSAALCTLITADGCDLSLYGTGSNLVNCNTNPALGSKIHLRNCKLNANLSIIGGTITAPSAPDVAIENCDSSGTTTRSEWYKYQGSIKTSTTVTKVDGAFNGVSNFSWNMTSNASNSYGFPLDSPVLTMWCSTIGSLRTATISFVHDNVAALTTNDLWLDIAYHGSSSTPLTSFAKTNLFPLNINSTALPTDTGVTWVTTGLSNPNYQKLQIQFTPQMQGLINIKVYFAKASYTVYVDPKIVLS